jgi:hypothetical protein
VVWVAEKAKGTKQEHDRKVSVRRKKLVLADPTEAESSLASDDYNEM